MGVDSVGSLLADIAGLIVDGLRILGIADKRHWGQDEHELLRAMERLLDDAKKDFQELSPLVKGQAQYERDRSFDSVTELRAVRAKFYMHIQNLKEWNRTGGPVNPVWVRDTKSLQRDLHRAQCRAVQRVFSTARESSQRCLGAFLVHRRQRAWPSADQNNGATESEYHKRQADEVQACNTIGGFERFSDGDIAFICDFCDGHLMWVDVERVPTSRSWWQSAESASTPMREALTPGSGRWQATTLAQSDQQEKQVIYPPVAVANHIAPMRGDWEARLMCPLCEEAARRPQDVDDEEDLYQPENQFDDMAALQEHLEWEHAPNTLPAALPTALPSTKNCIVM